MGETLAIRPARSRAKSLASSQSASMEAVRGALEDLAARDRTGEVLTALEHIPARAAEYAAMPEWVRPELAAAYAAKGVTQPYTHQAEAAESVHAGRNTVVVRPYAIGSAHEKLFGGIEVRPCAL